jgi:hypothetical protein
VVLLLKELFRPKSKSIAYQLKVKRIRFSVKQKDGTNSWGFTFGEVEIFKTSKKNKIERIHASFINFRFDSH